MGKPLSIFDRMNMAEARADRLERLVLQQAEAIRSLTERVKSLACEQAVPQFAGDLTDRTEEAKARLSAPILRMSEITAQIASAHLLTVTEMRGKSRERHIAWPRQEAMLAMVEEGFSLQQIGRFLNRDHTTVMTGARAAKARRDGVGR